MKARKTTSRSGRCRQTKEPPALMTSETFPWLAAEMIWRGRDNASAPITNKNVMALIKIAAPVPSVLTTRPAKPGPIARAKVNCTELSLTASSNSSAGTSNGTKLCQAAV